MSVNVKTASMSVRDNGTMKDIELMVGKIKPTEADVNEAVGINVKEQISNKVDKVDGKQLSTNDYTTEEKNKLSGIDDGANKTVIDSALSSTSTNPVQNKVINEAISGMQTKVDSYVTEKGSSTSETEIAYEVGSETVTVLTMDEFDELKSDLAEDHTVIFKNIDEISDRSTNLANPNDFGDYFYDLSSGAISQSDAIHSTNFILCTEGEQYTTSPYTFWCSFFDIGKNWIGSSTQGQGTITIPENCFYFKLNFATSASKIQVNKGDSLLTYSDYTDRKIKNSALNTDSSMTIANAPADAKAVGDRMKLIVSDNWIDNTVMVADHILWATGIIEELSGYKYTENYSPIYPNTNYYVYFLTNMWCCYYDKDKNYISGITLTGGAKGKVITTPENAVYMRFSAQGSQLKGNYMNLGKVSKGYTDYKYYGYIGKGISYYFKDAKVVDINGAGDYTSLTAALYETGNDIIVKAGEYDIVTEYISQFGSDIWSTMTDSTTGMNNFQLGLYINNRKVTFESGAKIVCDLTDSGYTVTPPSKRFSALFIGENAVLNNVIVEATKTYYLCHDDTNKEQFVYYTNEYHNCIFVSHSLYSANVIGGGTHNGGRTVLDNCYFNNNLAASTITVRYHGTAGTNVRSEVNVTNCKFNGRLGVHWYGDTTCSMLWRINNNEWGGDIERVAESESYPTDNTIVYEWNNSTAN